MASRTPKLKLLKKDPMADKNDTFNIETMLNDNWDIIDTEVAGRYTKNETNKKIEETADSIYEEVNRVEQGIKAYADSNRPTKVSELENDAHYETIERTNEKINQAESNAREYTRQYANSIKPTKVSELENDKGYETVEGAQNKVSTAEQRAKAYADSKRPTKVSQLTNDTNYETVTGAQQGINAAEQRAKDYADNKRPTKVSELTNDADYETESGAHQKAKAAEERAKNYTNVKVAHLLNSAPGTLDTLNELAKALGNDPNFATTILNKLSKKSDEGHKHTKSGISNFLGSNKEKKIAHGLGKTPSGVYVTPIEKTNGYLGEVWVRYDANYIYVGNTGEYKGKFNWVTLR